MKQHVTPFVSDEEALAKINEAKQRGEWWKGRHEANDIYDPFWMKPSDKDLLQTEESRAAASHEPHRIRIDGSFSVEELLAFIHFHPKVRPKKS